MSSTDPLRLVGATLAHKYAIESLVRVEASTVVYRATNLLSNRSVGVRVLSAVAAVPESRRRSLYEGLVRDHAKLTELAAIVPAAYPLRDVGLVTTPHGVHVPFVALDWPHGLTLRQMVQPGQGAQLPESIDEVVALLEPVAVALAIAHEHGVVHGGISADRILFREDGPEGARRAMLLDFGVARVLRAIDDAPHEGASATDDVRSLAAILAQAIARSCGADARLDDPRTLRSRGVVASDELELVFARAMDDGAARLASFASVGEFWSALRRALGLVPLRSLEATIPPEHAGSSRSLRPTAHSAPPPPPAAARERAPYAYALGGIALVALVALTFARAASPGQDASATAAAPPQAAASCLSGMIGIGAASYRMGIAGDPDEPPHDVTVRAFCIDRVAVTTAAYKACSDRGECKRASRTNEWEGIADEDRAALDPLCTTRDPEAQASHPINCVTWEMAAAFCAARGARLPTETEWELGARAAAASVAEWVADWRAPITASAAIDPQGPPLGDERVVRGAHAAGGSPARFSAAPDTRSHAIGFRCAR